MNAILIRNVKLFDGTGQAPRREQVWVSEGIFTAFGAEALQASQAQPHLEIDGEGLWLTPGFVDLHRHCDWQALSEDFGGIELAQGITSALCGPCGMSGWPVSPVPEIAAQYADYIMPCLGKMPAGYAAASLAAYLAALSQHPLAISLGMLAGAGAVQTAVKGMGPAPFDGRQMAQALALLEDALADGALGMSMGLMYAPECYLDEAQRIQLLAPLRRRGGTFFCHIRGEGDLLVDSVSEIVRIAAKAEVPLQISHFKAVGMGNWGGALRRAIDIIESARNAGQDITVDFYPYDGGATTLLSLVPPVLAASGTRRLLAGLETRAGRQALAEALLQAHQGWDNMLRLIGPERVLLSYSSADAHQRCIGKSLAEIAVMHGQTIPDALSSLLVESQGKAGAILMSMDTGDIRTIARLPYSMLISDSLYTPGGRPHPRLYGSFPKFLRMCREETLLSPETAIHKMTGLPAWRAKLQGRGVVQPGARADFLLFRPEAFQDRATYQAPAARATGLERVYIGGRLSWEKEAVTGFHGEILHG